MKRNSMFMWAYISFIFISVILRVFLDYQLWEPIVVAVTLSSLLFSFEDLYSSLEKTTDNLLNVMEDFASEVRDHSQYKLSIMKKMDKSIDSNKAEKYSDFHSCFNSKRTEVEAILQLVAELEYGIQDKRKTQKRYRKVANIFSYLGFLAFFCTLIFASQIIIPAILQEILTALSFSIVLLTHQIDLNKSRTIRNETMGLKDTIKKHLEERKKLSEVAEEFDYFIKSREGADYAD